MLNTNDRKLQVQKGYGFLFNCQNVSLFFYQFVRSKPEKKSTCKTMISAVKVNQTNVHVCRCLHVSGKGLNAKPLRLAQGRETEVFLLSSRDSDW